MVIILRLKMPFLSSICAILVALDLVHCQLTQSFNDWTASGVEKEAELMFRIVIKSQDYLSEISDDIVRSETDATTLYQSTLKELYDNTRKDVEFAAEQASKADFAQCAAEARNQEVAIVNKYRTQLQESNQAFIDSAIKFKNSQALVIASFSSFSLRSVINSFRECNGDSSRSFNSIIRCYKSSMEEFTNKIHLVNSAVQNITSEYLILRKTYLSFETVNKLVISRAMNESQNVVTTTLNCAELGDRTNLQITLDEIAKLDACTLDDLKQNTSLANTLANSLRSILNLAKSLTSNNLQASVQQCVPVVKYFTLLGLPSSNESALRYKIRIDLLQETNKLNWIISKKMQSANKYLNSVKQVYVQYKLSLDDVSEENLRQDCVPNDIKLQIIQEDEIKMCLSKKYFNFAKSTKRAKTSLANIITTFKSVEKDVLLVQEEVNAETINAEKIIKDSITNMLVKFGYDPQNICKIIENYFSSSKYQTIFENQQSIKFNLNKVQLVLDSLTFNLDSEVDSVLGVVRETIEIIKVFNPTYNTDTLNTTYIKLKSELKSNLIFYVNMKYKEALSVIKRALDYNYDKELSSFSIRCSKVDLCQIVSYFEPRTSSFINTLIKALRLSENSLSDIKYFIDKLWNEIKIFSEYSYNKTKIIANNISLNELNKAVPGSDCRKTAVLEIQALSDEKLKSSIQAVVESSYKNYLKLEDSVKKTSLEIESLYRKLRLAYEKSYKETPDQPIPLSIRLSEIDKELNASYQKIRSSNNNYVQSRVDSIRNEYSKRVVDYAKDLLNSKCTCTLGINSFEYCIKDIRDKYVKALNVTEKFLQSTLKYADDVLKKRLELYDQLQARELKAVENKINEELQKLGGNV